MQKFTQLRELIALLEVAPSETDKIAAILIEINNLEISANISSSFVTQYSEGVFFVDKETVQRLLSLSEWQQLSSLILEHEKQQIPDRNNFSYLSRLKKVLEYYKHEQLKALSIVKAFREDVSIWMRAIAMVASTAGNASTHREKDARIRGLVSLVESCIQKIREEQKYFHEYYTDSPDLFRSDYPVQQYIQEIRCLEAEIKRLQNKNNDSETGVF